MTEEFNFEEHSHRRFNPLTNSWVLCSPHRTKRPWQGQNEVNNNELLPEYDPKCYLCPGNERAQGAKNYNYENTFIFSNDFAAVKIEQPEYLPQEQTDKFSNLLRAEGVRGECKVMCLSPKHNITVAEMTEDAILHVIQSWIKIYQEMSTKPYINYIQIFENKGSIMGCSNPHPHCQIWCTETIPEEPSKELLSMKNYYEKNHSCLLCDYIYLETIKLKQKPRIICENDSFLCLTPFWAIWPYETMIISKSHIISLFDLNDRNKLQQDLANIIRRITCKYDNVFKSSFPYSMGIHQAPVDDKDHTNDSHLHFHFYPALLRSPTIKKFLVGIVIISVDTALPFVFLWRFAKPLLFSILPVSMKSMEETQRTPEIIVSWGKERIHLDFELQGAGSLEETTLKQLKERLKKVTGVPVNGQKLVFSGAVMKDNTVKLGSFGLHPFSKILLIVQTSTGSPEEHALIKRISESIEKTRTKLIPQIESFEISISSFLSEQDNDKDTTDTIKSKLVETHHYIVEALMQTLLTLDDVACPPEFETARKKRREAVKYTQDLIDRVDVVKEQLQSSSSINNNKGSSPSS
ncbi:14372_t:CDS:2 [Funneliformis caledonium]|uniref:Galactose-1-phosphate uridylyltransferase n=1 Tax=Funneliformis caledonium TaxID=1117310 RepID=A0A9N9GL58_9GLOM|nr:14372_t:CDS:2 [Funneliformis caledonium]